MSTFDETKHPRATAGRFTEKRQSLAEVRLERDIHEARNLPQPAKEAAEEIARQRAAGAVDERTYQASVAAAMEELVLEHFPRARSINFDVDHDMMSARPDARGIFRGSEQLWSADFDDTEFGEQMQAFSRQLVNPYFAPDDNVALRQWSDEMLVLRGWQMKVKKR